MAKGLWNLGPFNLPDWGVSERLGVGPANPAVSQEWYNSVFGSPKQVPSFTTATQNFYDQMKSPATPTGTGALTTPGAVPLPGGSYGGSSGGGGISAPNVDLNAVYDPYFNFLTGQEGVAKGQYETALGSLAANQKLAEQSLASQQKANEQQLGQQSTLAQQGLNNALTQARQLYNELSQANLSRFGSSSSIGPAAMELLGRATQQQMGGAQQQNTNIQDQIMTRKSQLAEFTQNELAKVKQSYLDKQVETFQAYQNRLISLDQNRAMLQSQKAQAKVNLDQQYQDQLRQLEIWRLEQQVGFDVWNSQQQALLNKGLASMPTSLEAGNFNNALYGFSQTGPRIAQAATVGTTPARVNPSYVGNYAAPYRYKQLVDGSWVDQYGNPIQ